MVADIPYPANMSPSRIRNDAGSRTLQIVFTPDKERTPEPNENESQECGSNGGSQPPVVADVMGSENGDNGGLGGGAGAEICDGELPGPSGSVKTEPDEDFKEKPRLLTAATLSQTVKSEPNESVSNPYLVKSALLPPRTPEKAGNCGDPAQQDCTQQPSTSKSSTKRHCWLPQAKTTPEKKVKMSCPSYKKVKGTTFAVDAFSYGPVSGVTAYFLSHFHWDHYVGLDAKWAHPVHCNVITAAMAKQRLKVDPTVIHAHEMEVPFELDGVQVTFIDANHCPGAAMILFRFPDSTAILHTGDFRSSDDVIQRVLDIPLDTVYLDTTYLNPNYAFPPQNEVLSRLKAFVLEKESTADGKCLYVCGTYALGKERVFQALCETLKTKAYAQRRKVDLLTCTQDPGLTSVLADRENGCRVHLVEMRMIQVAPLRSYLSTPHRKDQYTEIVGICPTGWETVVVGPDDNVMDQDLLTVETSGPVTRIGIPYSEHSSYAELKQFVQRLRPKGVVATVPGPNGCNFQSVFAEWLK